MCLDWTRSNAYTRLYKQSMRTSLKLEHCRAMPRSERKQNRRPEIGARGHSRPARRGTSAGRAAYSAPNNVVSIDQAAIPVNRPTLTIPPETAVVYAEGRLVASVLKETQELKDAVRSIEAHLGIRFAHHGNVPVSRNQLAALDRKSTRLNSSHLGISYA